MGGNNVKIRKFQILYLPLLIALLSFSSSRVARYAVLLGLACGLSSYEIEIIRQGALLHDIGKLAVPDKVLFKKGKLSEEEMSLIRTHPVVGAHIVRSRALKEVVPIVLSHHERVDGSGYPRGLKKAKIPLDAQIVGIADVYEALTSDRVYRKAMTPDTARQIMLEEMKGQFSTKLLEKFLKLLNNLSEERRDQGNARGNPGNEITKQIINFFNINPYAVSSPGNISASLQTDIDLVSKTLEAMALSNGISCQNAYDCVYYYRSEDAVDTITNQPGCILGLAEDNEAVLNDNMLGSPYVEPLIEVSGKQELLLHLNNLIPLEKSFCLGIFYLDGLLKIEKSYSSTVVLAAIRELVLGLKSFLPAGNIIYRPERDLLAVVVEPLETDRLINFTESLVNALGLDLRLNIAESYFPKDGETALELYYGAAGNLRVERYHKKLRRSKTTCEMMKS